MTRLAVIITVLFAFQLFGGDKKMPCPKGNSERVECAEVKRGIFIGKWHVFGFFTRRELRGAGDVSKGAQPISAYPLADLIEELGKRGAQPKVEQEKGTHPATPRPNVP